MAVSFCLNFTTGCKEASAPVRVPVIREFWLVESGILGFGIWTTVQRIRNTKSDWNPESKFQRQTGFWNCRRVYIFQLQDAPLTNKCGSNISKFSSDVLASY